MTKDNVKTLLAKAEKALRKNDRRSAGILINRVLRQDFVNPRAWHLLHHVIGQDQPFEVFQRRFAEKYFPNKAYLLEPCGNDSHPAAVNSDSRTTIEYCPRCGKPQIEGTDFCPYCGKPLSNIQPKREKSRQQKAPSSKRKSSGSKAKSLPRVLWLLIPVILCILSLPCLLLVSIQSGVIAVYRTPQDKLIGEWNRAEDQDIVSLEFFKNGRLMINYDSLSDAVRYTVISGNQMEIDGDMIAYELTGDILIIDSIVFNRVSSPLFSIDLTRLGSFELPEIQERSGCAALIGEWEGNNLRVEVRRSGSSYIWEDQYGEFSAVCEGDRLHISMGMPGGDGVAFYNPDNDTMSLTAPALDMYRSNGTLRRVR